MLKYGFIHALNPRIHSHYSLQWTPSQKARHFNSMHIGVKLARGSIETSFQYHIIKCFWSSLYIYSVPLTATLCYPGRIVLSESLTVQRRAYRKRLQRLFSTCRKRLLRWCPTWNYIRSTWYKVPGFNPSEGILFTTYYGGDHHYDDMGQSASNSHARITSRPPPASRNVFNVKHVAWDADPAPPYRTPWSLLAVSDPFCNNDSTINGAIFIKMELTISYHYLSELVSQPLFIHGKVLYLCPTTNNRMKLSNNDGWFDISFICYIVPTILIKDLYKLLCSRFSRR